MPSVLQQIFVFSLSFRRRVSLFELWSMQHAVNPSFSFRRRVSRLGLFAHWHAWFVSSMFLMRAYLIKPSSGSRTNPADS